MTDAENLSRNKAYSRVVRRGGRAIRLSAGRGSLADALYWTHEADRLHHAFAAAALAALTSEYEPFMIAGSAARKATWRAIRQTLAAPGYQFVNRTWRRKRMITTATAGTTPDTPGDGVFVAATDLVRAAREAWLDLAGGGDPARRAAVAAELELERRAFSNPFDPPAVVALADVAAAASQEAAYFHFRYCRGLHDDLDPSRLAFLGGKSAAASGLCGRLTKTLAEARVLLARADHLRARAARLRGRKRKKKKAATKNGTTAKAARNRLRPYLGDEPADTPAGPS